MTELAKGFPLKQWVCVPCGCNMIGEMPEVCPFCGARHDRFVSWDIGEDRYRVEARDVTDGVSQLLSRPRLGLEHACYRIETDEGPVWIDCPSAFNRTLAPVDHIYFTHKDYMGASNQYRAQWNAAVHIHEAETKSPLAAAFPVDNAFHGDFTSHGIEAFHIGGHTPGFTAYLWRDVLFACDYAFPPDGTAAQSLQRPCGDREPGPPPARHRPRTASPPGGRVQFHRRGPAGSRPRWSARPDRPSSRSGVNRTGVSATRCMSAQISVA